VLPNAHAAAAGAIELIKEPAHDLNLFAVALDPQPALARGDLHLERIFQRFQEPEIVRVERLQHASAFKLERLNIGNFR
jgi:hypothetical protein